MTEPAGYIYCDIDGVIFPYASRNKINKSKTWPDSRPITRDIYATWPDGRMADTRETFYPDVGRCLRSYMKKGWEIIWVTTWLSEATHTVGPLVGLPGRNYLPFEIVDSDEGKAVNKYTAVFGHYMKHSKPAVWIDDEAISLSNARINIADDDLLMVETNPTTGFTPEDHERITTFIDNYGGTQE